MPTKPKLIANLPPSPPLTAPGYMIQSAGHNTYRPDIYRTTEGYLN